MVKVQTSVLTGVGPTISLVSRPLRRRKRTDLRLQNIWNNAYTPTQCPHSLHIHNCVHFKFSPLIHTNTYHNNQFNCLCVEQRTHCTSQRPDTRFMCSLHDQFHIFNVKSSPFRSFHCYHVFWLSIPTLHMYRRTQRSIGPRNIHRYRF